MNRISLIASRVALALAFSTPLLATERSGFGLDVLVDQEPLREYSARGGVYVEAMRGRSYELRVTNPLPYRVAVALSVDGLNTLDAKHSSAARASKWVIEPYDSIVISGWQVNENAARQFFFTGEERSYGAAIGQTENLGVIEAVFFREREREPIPVYRPYEEDSRRDAPRSSAAPPSAGARPESSKAQAEGGLSDDYAATGMGRRHDHAVERVEFDLDPNPAATLRIRYEFRPALVKLGILPHSRTPLMRREAARGFAGYCPEPD
jgi:hypothetical protein